MCVLFVSRHKTVLNWIRKYVGMSPFAEGYAAMAGFDLPLYQMAWGFHGASGTFECPCSDGAGRVLGALQGL